MHRAVSEETGTFSRRSVRYMLLKLGTWRFLHEGILGEFVSNALRDAHARDSVGARRLKLSIVKLIMKYEEESL